MQTCLIFWKQRKTTENRLLIEGIAQMNFMVQRTMSLFGSDENGEKSRNREGMEVESKPRNASLDPPSRFDLDGTLNTMKKMMHAFEVFQVFHSTNFLRIFERNNSKKKRAS